MPPCETVVRTSDPDRYIATLFAPADKRPHLFALYALNHELAGIADRVREPMMAEIRLQWWRDALADAREGRPRGHDVLQAMADAFAAADIPQNAIDAMIDARSVDASGERFADMAALEAYADATSGNLMRVAASILGGCSEEICREAGIAYALCGILRALPFHAARGKLFLPRDMLKAASLEPEAVFAGRDLQKMGGVFSALGDCAQSHLAAARKMQKPGNALAAVLPAATVPLYLKALTKPGFNPFRDRTDLPMYRRQPAMLLASLRGRP